jgi:hypothetical protein
MPCQGGRIAWGQSMKSKNMSGDYNGAAEHELSTMGAGIKLLLWKYGREDDFSVRSRLPVYDLIYTLLR